MKIRRGRLRVKNFKAKAESILDSNRLMYVSSYFKNGLRCTLLAFSKSGFKPYAALRGISKTLENIVSSDEIAFAVCSPMGSEGVLEGPCKAKAIGPKRGRLEEVRRRNTWIDQQVMLKSETRWSIVEFVPDRLFWIKVIPKGRVRQIKIASSPNGKSKLEEDFLKSRNFSFGGSLCHFILLDHVVASNRLPAMI